MSDEAAEVPLEQMDLHEIELSPPIEAYLDRIKQARKRLLKDNSFERPDQLRQYIAQFVWPLIDEGFRLFGIGMADTYSLAASTMEELQHSRRSRSDDDEEGEEVGRLDIELLVELQHKMYRLGNLLDEKASGDTDLKEAYNECAQIVSRIVGSASGPLDDDEGDRYSDDRGGDSDGGGDGSEGQSGSQAEPEGDGQT